MKRSVIFSIIFLLITGIAFGQTDIDAKKKKKGATTEVVKKKDTDKTSKVKPYKEVITKDAKTRVGLFTVHKVKENYFFEIPDSLLGRDILTVGRIAKATSNSPMQYAGDHINKNVIRFEKGPNDKLFVKSISYSERSEDTAGMFLSVLNSNLQPIVGTFDIVAYYKADSNSKSKNLVVDITDFFGSDNTILFFNKYYKKRYDLGGLIKESSYIDTIKSFSTNIEIRTVKTYNQVSSDPTRIAGEPITYELNCSMLLLPKEPMKPRYVDPRVGYFTVSYTDFDANPQGIERRSLITRWRLEPKDEDIEKYKRGELVEPKKPIIYYIDPSTPKKWVSYLKQGVDDWQVAFEQAGFKNAIYALEAPEDSTWSLEDARHSAIVYKPSSIPNASGPHVNDPRSGEILESHINWYHNVMLLLKNWYFIQASPIDPRAQTLNFDDELMGQLIRFVSSHEVGHTLGLRHNWGSSATVSTENLRNKAWVEANGHTPSIMDYARFNYVAQPEDNISQAGIFPRIGIYDKWAIQWGYQWLPQYSTPEEESAALNQQVIDQLNQDIRYSFGTESDPDDPRNQNEDLGDDAVKSSTYGIKNLQRILPNILTWTKEANKDYDKAEEMYDEVVGQYSRYMGHVAKNIAGIYTTLKKVEQEGPVVAFVPKNRQKEAMQFLAEQLFITPEWLISKDLFQLAGVNPVYSIGRVQKTILNRLLNSYTFDKLLYQESIEPADFYSVLEMLDDCKKAVWTELSSGKTIDIYRRNLQSNYIDALGQVITPKGTPYRYGYSGNLHILLINDATAIARGHLMALRTDINRVIASAKGVSKFHLQDMLARIDSILDAQKNNKR
ncbi:MAG: zinc-dependent metalloprotease [Bacteroidales bacterium]|jgi:hypothetical protein|nr:zinc-dependent metalloprotease [Bacteroidales bacterium]